MFGIEKIARRVKEIADHLVSLHYKVDRLLFLSSRPAPMGFRDFIKEVSADVDNPEKGYYVNDIDTQNVLHKAFEKIANMPLDDQAAMIQECLRGKRKSI